MIEMSIGTGGDGAVISRAIGIKADIITDLKPTFNRVVKEWAQKHFQKQFESDGRYGGKPWVGYGGEPTYAAIKMEVLGHNELLRWQIGGPQEWLYPSLTDTNHYHNIFRVTDSSVTVGTSVPHAQDIERDNRGPDWSGNEPSPARIIMTAKDQQKRQLLTLIHRDLKMRLNQQGVKISGARINL